MSIGTLNVLQTSVFPTGTDHGSTWVPFLNHLWSASPCHRRSGRDVPISMCICWDFVSSLIPIHPLSFSNTHYWWNLPFLLLYRWFYHILAQCDFLSLVEDPKARCWLEHAARQSVRGSGVWQIPDEICRTLRIGRWSVVNKSWLKASCIWNDVDAHANDDRVKYMCRWHSQVLVTFEQTEQRISFLGVPTFVWPIPSQEMTALIVRIWLIDSWFGARHPLALVLNEVDWRSWVVVSVVRINILENCDSDTWIFW